MDQAFWLDHVLSVCATLSALVLVYGAWLCLGERGAKLVDWVIRRLRVGATASREHQKEA
jgi:hypothetical protein